MEKHEGQSCDGSLMNSLPCSMQKKMIEILQKPLRPLYESSNEVACTILSKIEENLLEKEAAEFRRSVHNSVSEIASGLASFNGDEMKGIIGEIKKGCLDIKRLVHACNKIVTKNRAVWTTVTSHHSNLKECSGRGNAGWNDVISMNLSGLKPYAEAAAVMGEKQWVRRGHAWMEEVAKQYFYGHLAVKSWKKAHRASGEGESEGGVSLDPLLDESEKIRLLDVGSCFNPHLHSDGDGDDSFDVTALDLEPSHDTVYTGDFLSVAVGDSLCTIRKHGQEQEHEQEQVPNKHLVLTELPRGHYHAATMSLVLNYLPSASEREAMVSKAREFLLSACSPQPLHAGGLLLIAEKFSIFPPTSKGALLSRFVLTWKRAFRRLGFSLVRYQVVQCKEKKLHMFAVRVDDEKDEDNGRGRLVIKTDFEGREEEMLSQLCEWKDDSRVCPGPRRRAKKRKQQEMVNLDEQKHEKNTK